MATIELIKGKYSCLYSLYLIESCSDKVFCLNFNKQIMLKTAQYSHKQRNGYLYTYKLLRPHYFSHQSEITTRFFMSLIIFNSHIILF